ncbi:hypothetical protein ACS0TY_024563 [Phlomoides rotata]
MPLLSRRSCKPMQTFTSGIEAVKDRVACTCIFFFEIAFVFRVPQISLCSLCEASGYKIEKNALDGCPGIEKEGRFQRRKAMGRYRL